jgi:hypothetical protein
MELNRNPFRYGADFDTDDMVGRKDEMARVVHAIRDGQRLFLIGPRGFGKTSILRAAQANLSQEGAIVLYVNAETSPDIAKLVGEIVAGTAAQVYEGTEDGIQKASRFFSHLEPTFTLSAAKQAISVSIGIDLFAGKFRQMEVLADTLDSLNRLAQSLPDSRPLALIIDEFSALIARFGVTAEAQIRTVVQCHRNVGYIIAGSNVGLMMDMTTRYSRPFYHCGDNLYLRPVPSADFVTWLNKQFKDEGYATEESEPVLRILSLAEDVPYNVQMLAHNCWNKLDSGKWMKLTIDLVETVFEQTIQSLDPSFEERWNRLTSLQQKTLSAVLHGKGQRVRPAEIAYSIKSPTSSVRSALCALYATSCGTTGISENSECARKTPFLRIGSGRDKCEVSIDHTALCDR